MLSIEELDNLLPNKHIEFKINKVNMCIHKIHKIILNLLMLTYKHK
jgi:hypothetical protein